MLGSPLRTEILLRGGIGEAVEERRCEIWKCWEERYSGVRRTGFGIVRRELEMRRHRAGVMVVGDILGGDGDVGCVG